VSSFAHATEDLDKVVRAIQNTNPQELMEGINTERVRGHHGNQIIACYAILAGRPKAERFFNHLWANLPSLDRAILHSRAESQIDESGTLHIRLGKQEALKGRFTLKDDEPIKIEISFVGWDRARSIADQVKTRLAESQ
jgi:RNA binding exosome subunit